MSVIIPAHDEEAVIGRCLGTLLEGAEPGELEIVVVCNGCRDGTAAAARAAAPEATVVELPQPSKAAALNEGDRWASAFPRVYLDADVEVSVVDLRRVAEALAQPGVLCAAPLPHFALRGRPWVVRKFYEAWERLPYLTQNMVGSGFYALSKEGRVRFDGFPDVTGDDHFVLQHFEPGERRAVAGASFVIHPPHSVRGLLAVRARVYRGNRELEDAGTPAPLQRRRGAIVGLVRPGSVVPAAVYVLVNTIATFRSRWRPERWERDDSTRTLQGRSADPTHRIGYITSRYPSVSHTFVLREVLAGRAAGLDVRTFSVRGALPHELLSAVDREEADSTWSVRPVAPAVVARSVGRAVLGHPVACAGLANSVLGRARPGLRAHLWQLFYLVEAVLLWEECRRQGVRHLHAHHANVAADLAWIVADLGERVDGPGTWTWTLTFHGSAELADVRGVNLAPKLAAAALVITVSDYTRAQLLPLLAAEEWPKVVVVHTGTDLTRYRPAAVPPPAPPVEILSVGRIDPVKGYPVLLQALVELRDRDCRLTIVGGGDGLERLRDDAERLGLGGRVRLPGPVGQDELPELFRAAHIFCLPSFTESLPVVLMEAMAAGLPVIATEVAGIPELVEDEESGLLVPPGRADHLAAALARLIDDPAERRRLGAAGLARVRADFDAAASGRKVAALLAAVPLRHVGR